MFIRITRDFLSLARRMRCIAQDGPAIQIANVNSRRFARRLRNLVSCVALKREHL